MWVIVTYDVGVKRNTKVRKICRKYLLHVQKSVFEGHIREKELEKMKWELEREIDVEQDQIAIYIFDTLRYSSKDLIGYQIELDNIL